MNSEASHVAGDMPQSPEEKTQIAYGVRIFSRWESARNLGSAVRRRSGLQRVVYIYIYTHYIFIYMCIYIDLHLSVCICRYTHSWLAFATLSIECISHEISGVPNLVWDLQIADGGRELLLSKTAPSQTIVFKGADRGT